MIVLGALYMAWIGFGLVRSSIVVANIDRAGRMPLFTVFRQGLVTCLLNPKAYLFIMAVYPQFLKPQYGSIAGQAAVMGALTVLMQFVIYGSVALMA